MNAHPAHPMSLVLQSDYPLWGNAIRDGVGMLTGDVAKSRPPTFPLFVIATLALSLVAKSCHEL